MDQLNDRISIFLLLVFSPLLLVTLAFFAVSEEQKAEVARLRVEAEAEALNQLKISNPSPNAENLAAARRQLDLLSSHLETLNHQLAQGGIPLRDLQEDFSTPQDLYFNLVQFVETYRNRALAKGIQLREDENFAFGSLLSKTAEFPLQSAEKIYLQRLVLGRLLDMLFDSEPSRLVSVQREPIPQVDGENSSTYLKNSSREFFTLKPPSTARASNLVKTFGIRLAFTGRTENLRRFLQRISTLEIPVQVRGLAVTPAENLPQAGASKKLISTDPKSFGIFDEKDFFARAQSSPVPIVDANTSNFTVTLEYFELADLERAGDATAPSVASR